MIVIGKLYVALENHVHVMYIPIHPTFHIAKLGNAGLYLFFLGTWTIRTLANSDLIRTLAMDNSDPG